MFSYHIAPTYDFVQESLSHGADVEVIAPESLREEITDAVGDMYCLYKKRNV